MNDDTTTQNYKADANDDDTKYVEVDVDFQDLEYIEDLEDLEDIEEESKNDINRDDDDVEYNYINPNIYNFINMKQQYRFRPDLHQHPIEYTDLESHFSENFADYDEKDLYF